MNKPTKKLQLNRETVRSLTGGDLKNIAGGRGKMTYIDCTADLTLTKDGATYCPTSLCGAR